MTATATDTFQTELDKGNPNTVADVLQKMKLGTMLTPLKATLTLAAPGTAFTLDPPALIVGTCRVTDNGAGNAAEAPRQITDAGGTPSATVATLSDDGATITIEGTGAVEMIVEYIPRPEQDMTEQFAPST